MPRLFWASCAIGATALAFVLTSSSARAHVRPFPCDKITGGGWVFVDTGEKANFGAHGGCKDATFFGHVNFLDRSFGNPPMHVRSTSITGYTAPFPGSNRRDICGTAVVSGSGPFADGGEVDFHVAMIDFDNGAPGAGEPGGLDGFGIALSNGSILYILTTRELGPEGVNGGGGNIALHKPSDGGVPDECDGTAPDPGPYPES